MSFRRDYAHSRVTRGEVRKDSVRPIQTHYRPRFYPELAHIGGNRRILQNYRFNQGTGFNANPQPRQYYNGQNYQNGYQRNPSNFQGNLQPPPFQGPRQHHYNMQQKPEPMDIDRSLQTKPQHNMPFKRPAENSIQTPMNKIQRNFHLDTEYWPNDYPYEEGAVGESMREPEYAEEYFEQLPETFRNRRTF